MSSCFGASFTNPQGGTRRHLALNDSRRFGITDLQFTPCITLGFGNTEHYLRFTLSERHLALNDCRPFGITDLTFTVTCITLVFGIIIRLR